MSTSKYKENIEKQLAKMRENILPTKFTAMFIVIIIGIALSLIALFVNIWNAAAPGLNQPQDASTNTAAVSTRFYVFLAIFLLFIVGAIISGAFSWKHKGAGDKHALIMTTFTLLAIGVIGLIYTLNSYVRFHTPIAARIVVALIALILFIVLAVFYSTNKSTLRTWSEEKFK